MGHSISFIITVRNEASSVLRATIDGLLETTKHQNRDIVVVDDGSDVPVTCNHPAVLLVRNENPLGVSAARRQGAEITNGNVLVWLDAHMTFAPDWLDQMLIHVDTGSLLCSAAWDYEQSVCYCWGSDIVWSAERNYAKQCYPGFVVRHRTRFTDDGAVEVPMIIGGCTMILRETYKQTGGFSPFFRTYGVEDIDLSIRAWITGLGVKCVTSARVGHLYRSTFPYRVNFDHIEFNQLLMLRTVFEESTVQLLEKAFEPIPIQVRKWFDQVNWLGWRATVQANRRIRDSDFILRFVLEGPWAAALLASLPRTVNKLTKHITYG
jgi:GT2 family glycosyltransferase